MSFGFSLADIASIVQFGVQVYNGWRDSCGNYAEITGQVHSVNVLLRQLEDAAKSDKSLLNRSRNSGKRLSSIIQSCSRTLDSLNAIIEAHRSLGLSKSRRRNWDRLRFGRKARELEKLSHRLNTHVTFISAFVATVTVESTGRTENTAAASFTLAKEQASNTAFIKASTTKTEQKINELPEILRGTLAEMGFRPASPTGSTMTAYSNDDPQTWKAFRRRLIEKGIRSGQIKECQPELEAFFQKYLDPNKPNFPAQNSERCNTAADSDDCKKQDGMARLSRFGSTCGEAVALELDYNQIKDLEYGESSKSAHNDLPNESINDERATRPLSRKPSSPSQGYDQPRNFCKDKPTPKPLESKQSKMSLISNDPADLPSDGSTLKPLSRRHSTTSIHSDKCKYLPSEKNTSKLLNKGYSTMFIGGNEPGTHSLAERSSLRSLYERDSTTSLRHSVFGSVQQKQSQDSLNGRQSNLPEKLENLSLRASRVDRYLSDDWAIREKANIWPIQREPGYGASFTKTEKGDDNPESSLDIRHAGTQDSGYSTSNSESEMPYSNSAYIRHTDFNDSGYSTGTSRSKMRNSYGAYTANTKSNRSECESALRDTSRLYRRSPSPVQEVFRHEGKLRSLNRYPSLRRSSTKSIGRLGRSLPAAPPPPPTKPLRVNTSLTTKDEILFGEVVPTDSPINWRESYFSGES